MKRCNVFDQAPNGSTMRATPRAVNPLVLQAVEKAFRRAYSHFPFPTSTERKRRLHARCSPHNESAPPHLQENQKLLTPLFASANMNHSRIQV
jgi:hypothetical protein